MRQHKAEVSCTAGAAKPDSGEPNNVSCWRSTRGEDTMRKHGAEVLNLGEPNNVSCWRSTRHPGRMAGGQEFSERMAGKRE